MKREVRCNSGAIPVAVNNYPGFPKGVLEYLSGCKPLSADSTADGKETERGL